MILTLNQVIKLFNDFSDGHYQLNDFGYGSPSDISTSRKTNYPLLWMTSQPSNYDSPNKTLTPNHSFAFIIADKYNNQENFQDDNGYNSSNVQEIMNDTELIARDLITFIQVNLATYGVSVVDGVTVEPLEDETTDKVFGWVINCTLRLKHFNCDIPGTFGNLNPLPPCADGSVRNSDSTYTNTVSSGGSLVLPDIDLTLNSGAFLTIPSVQDQNIILVDQSDTPIVPTSVVDNKITVTTSGGGGSVCSLNPIKTGQTTSYATNDDGDLEYGRGVDFVTLDDNNPFGNTNRFTDELGGQTYTNKIYIDWQTKNENINVVIGYVISDQQDFIGQPNMAAKTWANWMSGQPYTLHSLGSWYVANKYQLDSICNYGVTYLTDYAPISHQVVNGATQLYCSTTNPQLTTNTYGLLINSEVRRVLKTNSQGALLMRYFTYAELGL